MDCKEKAEQVKDKSIDEKHAEIATKINQSLLKSELCKKWFKQTSKIKPTIFVIKDKNSYNDWQAIIEEDCPNLDILKSGIEPSEACMYAAESEDFGNDWYTNYTSKHSIRELANQIISCRLAYKDDEDTIIDWYLVMTHENKWQFSLVARTFDEDLDDEPGYIHLLNDTIYGDNPYRVVEIVMGRNFKFTDLG